MYTLTKPESPSLLDGTVTAVFALVVSLGVVALVVLLSVLSIGIFENELTDANRSSASREEALTQPAEPAPQAPAEGKLPPAPPVPGQPQRMINSSTRSASPRGIESGADVAPSASRSGLPR